MSFDRKSLGSPLFMVGDIIVVPVEETGRGLFKEIFFVVRWLSTYCIKSPFRIWISGWIWKTYSDVTLTPFSSINHHVHMMVDGAKFWISCKWLKLLRKASRLQLIQNSAPSTIVGRKCDIGIHNNTKRHGKKKNTLMQLWMTACKLG